MSNPWKSQALTRANQYSENSAEASIEAMYVNHEYAGHNDDSEPCERDGCNGRMHYRSTVGAWQCPDCRGILTHAGKFIA